MRKPLLAGCFFLGSLLLAACQRHAAKPVPGSIDSQPAAIPERPATPFKITVSTGGGFTGAVSGCTLGSDGQVEYWDKRGPAPESIRWHAVSGTPPILEFRRLLETGGAFGMTLRETGNMTTMVKLELPDTLRIWSWSGHGASETTPEPFRSWFPQVEKYCQDMAPAQPASAAPSDPPIPKPDPGPEPDRK